MSRHLRSARPAPEADAMHLRVDPSVCDGVGLCAHLAPDLVALDTWGYPVVTERALTDRADLRQARAAVTGCPKHALHLLDSR